MKIGCDVDGCLADFSSAYVERLIKTTGKDLFTPENNAQNPSCWNWDIAAGYTKAESSAAWATILTDATFWARLEPLDRRAIRRLYQQHLYGYDDVYFITNRMGVSPKQQTEDFLAANGYLAATVLVAADKGPIINSLGLEAYIDDRPDTIEKLVGECPGTKIFIKDASYNREVRVGHRVHSVSEMLDILYGGQHGAGD